MLRYGVFHDAALFLARTVFTIVFKGVQGCNPYRTWPAAIVVS
ncbi:hypothetical protein N018_14955 [Pseudomonas syringae CC1557]|uniref:Uncharacterized protein n=1 Tax=Pseudomonas syringae CC1557 TaxID=1357279 RepID=W0N3J7_PSESX|nr:hypothetical protein N018_14955 [Pseudomonas syringae CC1557]